MGNVWNTGVAVILSCFGNQNLPWEAGWVSHEYPAYNVGFRIPPLCCHPQNVSDMELTSSTSTSQVVEGIIRDIRALSPAQATQSTSEEGQWQWQWWWWRRRLKWKTHKFWKGCHEARPQVWLHNEPVPSMIGICFTKGHQWVQSEIQIWFTLWEGNFWELMGWLPGEWVDSFKENPKMFTQAVRDPCCSLIDHSLLKKIPEFLNGVSDICWRLPHQCQLKGLPSIFPFYHVEHGQTLHDYMEACMILGLDRHNDYIGACPLVFPNNHMMSNGGEHLMLQSKYVLQVRWFDAD